MITTTVLVETYRNEPVTDSLKVANYFGKRHGDVIRAIDNIIKQGAAIGTERKIALSKMFKKTDYIDASGKSNRMYRMNFNGFSLVSMGFTGAKALNFKLDYIAAFNAMRDKLTEAARNHADPDWQLARLDTKISFKELARVINEELIPYAKASGSTHYDRFYVNYARLVKEFSGVTERDFASTEKLVLVNQFQAATIAGIRQGIKLNLDYTTIFGFVKDYLVDFLVFSRPRLA